MTLPLGPTTYANLSRVALQYLDLTLLRLFPQARKLYQTAVNVPMHDLDGMWREYGKLHYTTLSGIGRPLTGFLDEHFGRLLIMFSKGVEHPWD